MSGFEDLRIWKAANHLMSKINNIVKVLPFEEKLRIRGQIERSSSSIGANIAEGYMSYYYKDKIKSFYVARKEAAETQNHIRAMQSSKYLDKKSADYICNEYQALIKGINAFINYIRNKLLKRE